MSQTKQKQTELTTVQEDPRVRMKEIRALVANALKKNQRIDLMAFNQRDTQRVIVALQDQVMKSRERHRKASGLVAKGRHYAECASTLFMLNTSVMMDDDLRIAELNKALLSERESHMKTSTAMANYAHEAASLERQLGETMNTLKTALSGETR